MKSVFQIRTYFRSNSVLILYATIIAVAQSSCTSDPQKRPSPLRTDSATVRGIDAYIEFSSPGVKDRKIFGSGSEFLVPYGEMWRTGANNATYVSFGSDIMVDTFLLDSGRYALFTIPDEREWIVIFNKEWDQWGSYNYKDSLDAFRLKVAPWYADQSQERMLFYFAEDSLKFRWDKVRWAIPLNLPPEALR
ncbi:DUF2911 domain-containing protein [Ekhidna sp.]|uniref:DUF2911 domain-containing protein n=1 Tax=Ekhidna sp. TaxID=2608089 RepID=UPI003C7D6F8A